MKLVIGCGSLRKGGCQKFGTLYATSILSTEPPFSHVKSNINPLVNPNLTLLFKICPRACQILEPVSYDRHEISGNHQEALPSRQHSFHLRRAKCEPGNGLIMLGKSALKQSNSLQPLGLSTTHSRETHAHSGIKRAEPDAVNVLSALGEYLIEVLDSLQSLDLDDDGCLVVDALMEGFGGVYRLVGEAWHEACGRCRASAIADGTELGSRYNVTRLLDCVDLWHDDGCSGV